MKLHFGSAIPLTFLHSHVLFLFFVSLGASTVPAGGTQGGRVSRGSFASVTDVSSDEELDLDNI